MSPIISPRELAEAIGVSESSLKRWADSGHIRVSRTGGGHRRIAIGEAIRFIRAIKAPLIHPEMLGLRDMTASGEALLSSVPVEERFHGHLLEGRAKEARGLVMSMYLEGQSVAEIADGPIRIAMQRIGELWRHDQAGIFVEHRATDICIQAVEQLRHFVQPLEAKSIAVGGAPAGDPYLLPSLLVATALAAEGWNAINLGPNTPFDAMALAAFHHRPALVWLSVSSMHVDSQATQEIERLVHGLQSLGCKFAIGGQGLPPDFAAGETHAKRCHSIAELVTFANSVPGESRSEQAT